MRHSIDITRTLRAPRGGLIAGILLSISLMVTACNNRESSTSANYNELSSTEAPDYEETVPPAEEPTFVETSADDNSSQLNESPAERRYREKYEEVNIADIRKLKADGRRIWYNPRDSETGFSNRLYLYDSETDTEKLVILNKTSLDDDDMHVTDLELRGDVLTVLMEEMRNSNGWIEGSYACQYNCATGRWKPLAREVANVKFNDSRDAVKVTRASILNPEAPTCDQEYSYTYQTIPL